MDSDWKKRILELRYWEDEQEALEYVELVDMVEDHCDFDTCKVLMATFVTEEDFGVQESVNRVLSTANPADRQRALLEELPRLVVDTPEWADVLLETEIRFYLNDFKQTVNNISSDLRQTLDSILERESFQTLFPDLKIESTRPRKYK